MVFTQAAKYLIQKNFSVLEHEKSVAQKMVKCVRIDELWSKQLRSFTAISSTGSCSI